MTNYATTAEVKSRIEKLRADDDADILALIQASSQAIDKYCQRPDGFLADTVASAREYAGGGKPFLYIGECVAISLVEVKETPDGEYEEWADGDYIPFRGSPDDPVFDTPYEGIMVSANGNYNQFTSGQYSGWAGFRPTQRTRRKVPTVRVTARWGYADAIPPAVREACIAQVGRWYKRAESAWADTIARSEFVQLQYTKGLDPAVEYMLLGLRRVPV